MATEDRRSEAVAVAEAVLRGDLDVIRGAHCLAGLRFDWEAESDEDFLYMTGVASETDEIPLGPERKHWNAEALARKDEELREAIDWWGEKVREACRRIIEQYGSAVRAS